MKIYTTHWREGRDPRLVPEGFSWSALFFGFLFFAVTGAWAAAALSLAITLLLGAWGTPIGGGAPLLGFLVLQGLLAQDVRRFSLKLSGWRQGPVVAAPGRDEALARLIGARPDLPASAGLT